jgi:TPR repeat protein
MKYLLSLLAFSLLFLTIVTVPFVVAAPQLDATNQSAIEQAKGQVAGVVGTIKEVVWENGGSRPSSSHEYLIARFEGTDTFGLVLHQNFLQAPSVGSGGQDLVGRSVWVEGRIEQKASNNRKASWPQWLMRKSNPFGFEFVEATAKQEVSVAIAPAIGDPVKACEGFSNTHFNDLEAATVVDVCAEAVKLKSSPEIQFQYARGLHKSGSRHLEEARKWYRKAADQGMVISIYAMGTSYEFANTAMPDYNSAMAWYRKAAAQGSTLAELRIAYLMMPRIMGPGNPGQAFQIYQRLAETGMPDAQFATAYFYEEGFGVVEVNYRTAARWYRLAADQGHAGAQNNLGTLYLNCPGTFPCNREKAMYWYTKSAEQGFQTAIDNLDWIKSEPERRARAREIAQFEAEVRAKSDQHSRIFYDAMDSAAAGF